MKLSTMAWLFAGSTSVGVVLSMVACSSSTTSDAAIPSDSGACPTAPRLYAESVAGVYCPYSVQQDSGAWTTCPATEHCCEPSGATAGSSACTPATTACPSGSTDWQCLGLLDCAGGQVCCAAAGTLVPQAACGTQPAYSTVSGFTGTACAASCATFRICQSDSDCGSGAAPGACAPATAMGSDFGHCTNE